MELSAPSPPESLRGVQEAQVPVRSAAVAEAGSLRSPGANLVVLNWARREIPARPHAAVLTAQGNLGNPDPDPPGDTCGHQLPTRVLEASLSSGIQGPT